MKAKQEIESALGLNGGTLLDEPAREGELHYVQTKKNESVTLHGTTSRSGNLEPYSKTFKMGDQVTYDSYNLIYLGTIVSITEKVVTVQEPYADKKLHRMKIAKFSRRNRDFDLEAAKKHNADTSMYI